MNSVLGLDSQPRRYGQSRWPRNLHRYGYLLAIQTALALRLSAQIITDGSMGAAMNLSGPNFQIPETLGTRAGANLFHSFQSFNLSQGERATFTGGTGIQHLVARVTGGTVSKIDGMLASEVPGANLYLMNPAGVVFGPNARLQVPGDFAVTTADQIEFAMGSPFGSKLNQTVTLSSAAPVAFGFLGDNPKAISFNGSQLAVGVGRLFNIVGGALEFRSSSDISAPSGNLLLASVGSPGSLLMANPVTSQFSSLGDIALTGGAQIKASGARAGNLLVRCRNLNLAESTNERFTSLRNETFGNGLGGRIDIGVDESITISGASIVARSARSAIGSGSDIAILAKSIALRDGGIVTSDASGLANAGSISIVGSDNISILGGQNTISSRSLSSSLGNAGTITLRSGGSINIKDQEFIESSANGGGNAAEIRVEAKSLSLNSSYIHAIGNGLRSRGGDIHLTSRGEFRMTGESGISSEVFGRGNAGSVYVSAGSVVIDGAVDSENKPSTYISTTSGESVTPAGRAGRLVVSGTEGVIARNAQFQSTSFNPSAAGNIDIRGESILMSNSQVRASSGANVRGNAIANSPGMGGDVLLVAKSGNISLESTIIRSRVWGASLDDKAGNISIQGHNITLWNGTSINSTAGGLFGSGGNIDIVATGTLDLGYSIPIANANPSSADNLISTGSFATDGSAGGVGGNVTVAAHNVQIGPRSYISSVTSTRGRAGDTTINATGNVIIDGGGLDLLIFRSGAFSGSENAGSAGTVNVKAGSIHVDSRGQVSSSATIGDAGSVVIETTTGDLMVSQNSQIVVSAANGNAGSIRLNSARDVILRRGLVSAAAGKNGGNVALAGRFVRTEDSSALVANAKFGDGGVFGIDTLLFVLPGSELPRVDSQQGQAGSVDVRNVVDIQSSLAQLPEGLLSDQLSIQLGCERDRPYASSLQYGSLQGFLASPSLWFPSSHLEGHSPE